MASSAAVAVVDGTAGDETDRSDQCCDDFGGDLFTVDCVGESDVLGGEDQQQRQRRAGAGIARCC